MKAQRRHELKENDLSHAMEVARDYLDNNGKTLATTVVIVAAVAAAVGLTVQSKSTARDDRWRRRADLVFTDAQVGRESLATLATLTLEADDDFAMSSLIEQGQQALRLAVTVDVPPDRQLTDTASDAFEQLLARFGQNPLSFGIAHLGLATVAENQFALDGDLSHRRVVEEHLSAVIDSSAMDRLPFKRIAMDRRNALDATFTQLAFAEPDPIETDENADKADPADVTLAPPPPAGSTSPDGN